MGEIAEDGWRMGEIAEDGGDRGDSGGWGR